MKRFWMVVMILGLTLGSVATAESKRKPQRTTRTIEGFLCLACDLLIWLMRTHGWGRLCLVHDRTERTFRDRESRRCAWLAGVRLSQG